MPCLPTELELGNMFYWHFELCSSAIVLRKTGDWGRWKMRLVAYHWKLKFVLYLLNVDCDSAEMWRIKRGWRDSLADKHNDLSGNLPLSYLIIKIKKYNWSNILEELLFEMFGEQLARFISLHLNMCTITQKWIQLKFKPNCLTYLK